MATPSIRGIFIVFEGIDRSGKTTQAVKLNQYINDHEKKSVYLRFPDRDTPTGKLIDSYLKNEITMDPRTAHLIFSANRSEHIKTIVTNLKKGINVICDRYVDSGSIYSRANGLPYEWCQSIDVGMPRPDRVIYLRSSFEVTKKRDNFGAERFETESFQHMVSKYYDEIASKNNWNVIDSSLSIERIHESVVASFLFTESLMETTVINYL